MNISATTKFDKNLDHIIMDNIIEAVKFVPGSKFENTIN